MPATLTIADKASGRPAHLVPARFWRARCRHLSDARRTLLYAAATFVLIQLGLRVAIDFWAPWLRDPTFEIKAAQLRTHIARTPDLPYLVTMFGSSSTGLSFNGKYLERLLDPDGTRLAVVYNMSDHGAGPLTHLLYLRRLLDRGIRPNLVLLEIFPNAFKTDQPLDIDHFPACRLEWNDLDCVERLGLKPELRRQWWESRLVPSYGHRFAILHGVSLQLIPSGEQLQTWNNYDDHGWHAMEPRAAADMPEALRGVRSMFQDLTYFKPGKHSVQALAETLALLQKEGIPGVMVMTPVGPMMRSMYPPAGIAELKEACATLARRYDAVFFDAFTWLEEEMFNDSFHANVNGAKLFCDRLARELLIPLRDTTAAPAPPGGRLEAP